MLEYGDWTVKLNVAGKLRVIRFPLNLEVEKGFINSFWTKVKVGNAPNGVLLQVGVRAHDAESADDAALFFVGQALDVLALRLDMPLYLSLANVEARRIDVHATRSVNRDEWTETFQFGRKYGIERPIFSRGLSWYRKGLNSEDPIDKFLAFWAAIHGISAKFAEKNQLTEKGAINQICNCLDQLWRDKQHWKVIPGNPEAINNFQKTRSKIAHGAISIDIDSIGAVSAELHKLQDLVRAFLTDWEVEKAGRELPSIIVGNNEEITE